MPSWLPENVSTYGADIDQLYLIILWITGIIFIVVEAALIWFVVKYRHREGRKAAHIHGNWKVEVVWTVVPFILVTFIAAKSMGPWMAIKDPNRFPSNAVEIAIDAKQFEWNVTYPGADGRLGTDDDFQKRNQLHVPVGQPVRVRLSSEDVIHSLFLPSFRVKQDAVPGMQIAVWFEVTEPGEYVLGCAELCGLGHYRMRGSVTAYPGDAYDEWMRSGGTAAQTAAR
ncbi:MAG: cytochrome c oxidase subunit II [Longimicrobiales bacterium]